MITFDGVRALAFALPETEEGLSYGTPAFRVKGKLFARLRDDEELLVVKVGFGEREALMAEDPVTFSITPHYQNAPMVLVRLATVDPEHLRELLTEAWRSVAPKRLVAAFDAWRNRAVS
jgi:hypothetical protein